jgi:SAM-dependent methyltransferase
VRQPVAATIERAWQLVDAIESAYARGEIDRAEWHARMAAIVVPAYLAADNPRAQSGYGGDEDEWRQARGFVADAIDYSGTFLDVGCANGHLMESVVAWCAERGLSVEAYGLDIAPELIALAQSRLPQWKHRFFVGNAAQWTPHQRFDFVRTGLEYVPRSERRTLVDHLMRHVVANDGILLVGPYSEERDETRVHQSQEDDVRTWGLRVARLFERPHSTDPRVVRRLLVVTAKQG